MDVVYRADLLETCRHVQHGPTPKCKLQTALTHPQAVPRPWPLPKPPGVPTHRLRTAEPPTWSLNSQSVAVMLCLVLAPLLGVFSHSMPCGGTACRGGWAVPLAAGNSVSQPV